ncbi:Pheromone-binding protein Gp-9 [Formica fusca]
MKAFILCVYILGYVSFISTDTVMSKLQTRPEDPGKELVDICLSQVNLTREEAYNVDNILNNVHEQPEMKEKRRKHGCAIECILKKMNWMEGTELKEERIYAIVTKLLTDHLLQAKAQKLIRDCAKEVRDTTPERCEKGVTAMVCTMKGIEKNRISIFEKYEED